MTLGDWAFVLIVVVVAVCAVVCGIAWKVAYDDGWDDGRRAEKNRLNMWRIRERREARETRQLDEWDQWAAQLREDDGERLAETGELARLEVPRAPRTSLIGADTGTFRAIVAADTDAYISRMHAEEEAYREDLAS